MTPAKFLLDMWTELQKQTPSMQIELIPFENTPENAREILKNLGRHIDVVAGIYDDGLLEDRGCLAAHLSYKSLCLAVPLAHPPADRQIIAIDFTVAADNSVYRSENGHLIERASNTLVRGGQSGVVPDGITTIAQAAFRKSTVTRLHIPASVEAIGNYLVADSAITVIEYAGTPDGWNAVEKNERMWNYGNRDVAVEYTNRE